MAEIKKGISVTFAWRGDLGRPDGDGSNLYGATESLEIESTKVKTGVVVNIYIERFGTPSHGMFHRHNTNGFYDEHCEVFFLQLAQGEEDEEEQEDY